MNYLIYVENISELCLTIIKFYENEKFEDFENLTKILQFNNNKLFNIIKLIFLLNIFNNKKYYLLPFWIAKKIN